MPGEITEFRLLRSSNAFPQARLTYTKLRPCWWIRSSAAQEICAARPHLENLYALYKILNKARHGARAVDFELPETKIIYNDSADRAHRAAAAQRCAK